AVAVFLLADALHHLLARRLGRSGHDLAAGRLARAAPDGLAAHGNGLGLLTGLGHVLGEHLHGDLLLGEALNVHHEALFVQAHEVDRLAFAAGTARAADAVHVVFADVRDV